MKIVRSRGESAEREVELSEVEVPNLWHVATYLCAQPKVPRAWEQMVLECWHLCHDLLRELWEVERMEEEVEEEKKKGRARIRQEDLATLLTELDELRKERGKK